LVHQKIISNSATAYALSRAFASVCCPNTMLQHAH